MSSRHPAVAESGPARSGERQAAFQELIAAVQKYAELPTDWDRYGGKPAEDVPVTFAVALLEELAAVPGVPVPTVRPISGGVYLEWRFADALLNFEVDGESVLRHRRRPDATDTTEDARFDVEKAKQAVAQFIPRAT